MPYSYKKKLNKITSTTSFYFFLYKFLFECGVTMAFRIFILVEHMYFVLDTDKI